MTARTAGSAGGHPPPAAPLPAAATGRTGRRLRPVVSGSLLAAFAVWAVWYLHRHRGELAGLGRVSAADLASLCGAFLTILVCNGLFVREATGAFGLRLRALEWSGLSVCSSFANYFLPLRGGAGLRAAYLARVHRLHLADFLATLSAMFLMHAVASSGLALAGMTLVTAGGGPFDPLLGVFFAVVLAAGLASMGVSPELLPASSRFPLRQIRRFAEGWGRLRAHRPAVRRLWVLTLALALVSVWQCGQAFTALGIPLPPGGALLYAGAKNLAALAGLTPGSLGIVEGMSIYLGRSLGYSPAQALLVQGLIRAVAVAVLLLTGPVALHLLRRRLAEGAAAPGPGAPTG